MCCTRLAANAGPKNVDKNRHLGTIPQLCRAISLQLRHVSTIGKKNLLSSNISPTCPHNMVNIGPLAAEICWRGWGTLANFNGFRVLTALLHGSQLVSVQPVIPYLTSTPKFTILWGHLEEILLLNKFFFRLSIRALVANS